MEQKYLLGLDLGTDSVGWALTDQDYNVIRKSGKSLWGVRLFEAANDCKDRRLARCARRRIARRKERINLLQEIFAEEIAKTDPNFFQRLELSKYHFEDRIGIFNTSQTLFIENDFNDRDYYKKYPTIYHLRQELINSKEKADIRMIYLAIHHAIKYRGNFLSYGQKIDLSDDSTIRESFTSLNNAFSELGVETISFTDDTFKKLLDVSKSCKTISKLKENLTSIFSASDKYLKKVFIPLISGGMVNLKDIFQFEDESDEEDDFEIKKISFKDEKIDEEIELIIKSYDYDSYRDIIVNSKKIYDFILIYRLLHGEKYISNAMVNRYENHKEDLRELKRYAKSISLKTYNDIFRVRDEKKNNYVSYVGANQIKNHGERFSKCTKDDFYKFLKETLKIGRDIDSMPAFLKSINERMAEGTYLDKQNSKENGVFPYQLNSMEIELILEKQSVYYDFLKIKGEEGITPSEKIMSILEYQIPYYVGPLAYSSNSKNTWIKRKVENKKIYPWNFSDIVDKEATAEEFIRRMLNHCSYLKNEYCLPKNSITYSLYNLLNELNKISINSHIIDVEQKWDLLENLFKVRIVNKKMLKEYIKNKYGNDAIITTSNSKELEEIKSNLKSYLSFANIFGRDYVEKNIKKIDAIIGDITLFTDKSILESRLKKIHAITDKSIISKIKSLNYTGYGRLSEKLLKGIKTELIDIKTGEVVSKSILDIMLSGNENLMEILNNPNYNFANKIDSENAIDGDDDETIDKYVDSLYVSPGMKRPIVQSYRIIEELKKIVNHPIDEYYVECTRTNKAEQKRTTSRREKLIAIYEHIEDICKKETENYKDCIKQALPFVKTNKDAIKQMSDLEFRSDKLYLYYLQLGRCIYSNAPLSIEDVYDSAKCDIDHIIPQSILKDDSIENRVLVLQEKNREKTDEFPISKSRLFEGHKAFYKMLKELRFMGERKYNNLIRNDELTDSEIEQFVNRQLVYTNQAVKGLVDMIRHFENADETKIIYSKAENVSDFRKKFDLIKCRETNNFHHAHDAYLNIIVGRTLTAYFGFRASSKRIKEIKYNKSTMNVMKIFSNDKSFTSGESVIWNAQDTINKIKNQIENRFDIFVTTRQFIGNNLMEKVGLNPAGNGEFFPIKTCLDENNIKNKLMNTKKYGGYSGLASGYYCLVKSKDKKGNFFVSLEAMKNIYVRPDEPASRKLAYLSQVNGLIDPEIIVDKMRINTIIKTANSKLCITGKSGDSFLCKNIQEAIYSKEETEIIRKILKFKDIVSKRKLDLEKMVQYFPIVDLDKIIVSPAKGKDTEEISISFQELDRIFDVLKNKCKKKIYSDINMFKNLSEKFAKSEVVDAFKILTIYKKIDVISEMLKFYKCNREMSNLLDLGLCKVEGELRINKKIVEIKILNESITGFYSKVVYDGSMK